MTSGKLSLKIFIILTNFEFFDVKIEHQNSLHNFTKKIFFQVKILICLLDSLEHLLHYKIIPFRSNSL